VSPVVPERASTNPLITLEGTTGAAGWGQLPPVYATQTVFKAKGEAEILASAKFQNVPLNEPLILTRNIGGQKSFAVTGYGLWRWRLLTQGNRETERLLPLLCSNVVRWLTTEEQNKPVRITPVQEAFTTAEPVEFTGQVYDDQLRPVDNAEIPVTVTRGSENYRLLLTPMGNGRYEGSVDALPEGDYTFAGSASAGGNEIGKDNGKFSVGQVNLEFLETTPDIPLLGQIAFHTGGKLYLNGDVASFPDDLKKAAHLTSRDQTDTHETELWNSRYAAALIILLLAAEWFLRKRHGMI
jgi:hypothetical protein